MFVRILLTLCVMIGLAAPPARSAELQTFIPHWLPQAQFAGYYMAHEKGLYRKQGIDLMIMRGGPEFPPAEMIARNKVNFATMFLSTAVQLRDRGVRLVNIAQIVQRSGFILVAKKSSGIASPTDLKGKRVGLWPHFSLQPQAFFRQYKIDVRTIPQDATLTLFLRGGVDAASAMWYNEYHTLLNAGLNEDELKVFFFDQHGLNFPEDGLYCTEATFKRNPDLCRRFIRASLEGWQYAFANPSETLDVVMRHIHEANIGSNRVHQKWMLEKMKALIFPPQGKTALGDLNRADYLRVAGELKRNGLIKQIPAYGEFHVD